MKLPKFSNKDWFGWAVIVCIGVTLFVLLSNISSVIAVLARFIGFFRPVILGVIIAYIISPLVVTSQPVTSISVNLTTTSCWYPFVGN